LKQSNENSIPGIKVIHDDAHEHNEDYSASGLDHLFNAEERHFWFIARKEFIYKQINRIISKTDRILDIGAGTGNLVQYLMKRGYHNIAVGDIHRNGLEYALSYGVKECYQVDIYRLPFQNDFNAIFMFDVLEHLNNEEIIMQKYFNALKANGLLIITVPSHRWLWSRIDVESGHKKRYTKKELNLLLEKCGYDILVSKYFFILITPLLFFRRIMNPLKTAQEKSPVLSDTLSINPVMNIFLLALCRIENYIHALIPNLFGGSLMVIARKNDTLQ